MMSKAGEAITVTRKELFRQVWTTPMSRLAREYRISGNGLAKVCDRLTIPYPPRGYWAKKAAGKNVVQYRLPEREADTPTSVVITPTPPTPSPPELSPETREQIETVRSTVGEVSVPARLTRPHPIVAVWLNEREEERSRARRERNPWMRSLAPSDWTEMERRRHRLLDALFKAAEKSGLTVKQSDRFTVYFEALLAAVRFDAVRFPSTNPNLRTWVFSGSRVDRV